MHISSKYVANYLIELLFQILQITKKQLKNLKQKFDNFLVKKIRKEKEKEKIKPTSKQYLIRL